MKAVVRLLQYEMAGPCPQIEIVGCITTETLNQKWKIMDLVKLTCCDRINQELGISHVRTVERCDPRQNESIQRIPYLRHEI
jgi:hypothetical protein